MHNINQFNGDEGVLTLSLTFWITEEHLYGAVVITVIGDRQSRETLFNSLVFSKKEACFHLKEPTRTAELELKGNTDDKPIMAHP
jgi:hypothetical protein